MYRDNTTLRNLIEISHSGLGDEEQLVAAAILDAYQEDLAAAGVTLRETQRGAVAGRVILTVGPGAEIHAARLVSWLERHLASSKPRAEVYVHPYSLPRPMFYELPAQAMEARRQLLEAARSLPLPALEPACTATANA